MHFAQLAIFRALADTGSVTRAAERVMISQPAVSKQLKQFERTLGVTLFERGPRGVRLTDAGQTLAGYAKRIFDLSDEAKRAVRDTKFTEGGRVALGTSPTIGTYVMPGVLVHMRRRFPRIDVTLETASPRRLAAAIDESEYDVAVSSVPLPTRRPADQRAFGRESMTLIAPPGHPLARRRRPLAIDALATLPFVAYAASDPAQAWTDAAMAAHGVAMRSTLALGSTEAIKRAVAGGLGIAIVPAVAVADEVANGRLTIVRIAGLSLDRPIYLTTPAGRRESKATTAFLCLLKHGLRDTLPRLASPVIFGGTHRDEKSAARTRVRAAVKGD